MNEIVFMHTSDSRQIVGNFGSVLEFEEDSLSLGLGSLVFYSIYHRCHLYSFFLSEISEFVVAFHQYKWWTMSYIFQSFGIIRWVPPFKLLFQVRSKNTFRFSTKVAKKTCHRDRCWRNTETETSGFCKRQDHTCGGKLVI